MGAGRSRMHQNSEPGSVSNSKECCSMKVNRKRVYKYRASYERGMCSGK